MTPEVETPHAATGARGRHRSSAESRERLLTVAAELFAEHGYEATTVREIGRRAAFLFGKLLLIGTSADEFGDGREKAFFRRGLRIRIRGQIGQGERVRTMA